MGTPAPYHFAFEFYRTRDGVGFGRRPVAPAQLEPGREQLMFDGQRRGQLPLDLTGIEVGEYPSLVDSRSGEIDGLTLRVDCDGQRVERDFGLRLFQPVLDNALADLIERKQLTASEQVSFRVFASQAPPPPHRQDDEVRSVVRRRPLPTLPGQLAEFLELATAKGPAVGDDYPLFVMETALEQAHEIVWERNRERGVWMVGNLFRQTEPHPEIFGLIHTVFEARGATHERFRLDLHTETFVDLETQMDRRRKRLGRTHDLAMGMAHTHPFLPSVLDGKEACPTCPVRATCQLSSAQLFSKQDRQFHNAVFGHVPFAVEFVLGLTPREEFDLRLYSPDGGIFRERGYYRLAALPAQLLNSGEPSHVH
jgi:hypothetical protein